MKWVRGIFTLIRIRTNKLTITCVRSYTRFRDVAVYQIILCSNGGLRICSPSLFTGTHSVVDLRLPGISHHACTSHSCTPHYRSEPCPALHGILTNTSAASHHFRAGGPDGFSTSPNRTSSVERPGLHHRPKQAIVTPQLFNNPNNEFQTKTTTWG